MGLKADLYKIIKIKKAKVIGLEMNSILISSEIERMYLKLKELDGLKLILEENIKILKTPGIIARIGALDESKEGLIWVDKEISIINLKISKRKQKLEKTQENQKYNYEELILIQEEYEKPAIIIMFPMDRINNGRG